MTTSKRTTPATGVNATPGCNSEMKQIGYNPTLKEITEQLREQKEWVLEYISEYRREAPNDEDIISMETNIECNYNGLVHDISDLVAMEFRENVFYSNK